MQLLEVLGRAQLRVLLGDDAQAAERLAQHALRLARLRRTGRLHGRGASLRDLLEGLALVGRVALDRLDQVRDQVVPALQLDVDPRPGLVDPVARPDDRVADEDHDQPDQQQDDDDDDGYDHSATTSPSKLMRACIMSYSEVTSEIGRTPEPAATPTRPGRRAARRRRRRRDGRARRRARRRRQRRSRTRSPRRTPGRPCRRRPRANSRRLDTALSRGAIAVRERGRADHGPRGGWPEGV